MADRKPRDIVLTEIVKENLSKDVRLRRSSMRISVKGGVCHIEGTVPRREDRAAVRRAVSRVRGIDAVWDVLEEKGAKARVLDIGCGGKKQFPYAWGVDHHHIEGVDILADLENPLPFRDNTVDYIFAVHCLEHVNRLIPLMNEIHRVLAPGGAVHILVPNFRCVNSVADPTHVRFFDRQTFKYFCVPRHGIKPFSPSLVTETQDTVFADLSPVKNGKPDQRDFCLFFR